jgi:GR25 family glycosyltransferase involved in LPS biosynthesis
MKLHRLRNLYNCSLGVDPFEVDQQHLYIDSPVLVNILLNSDHYRATVNDREARVSPTYRSFDYSIISVDERSVDNINKIKSTLPDYKFHPMEYFKSTAENYKQFYNERDIQIAWDPDHSFGRADPLIGEFGVCGSQILALEYMVQHNIPEMIVMEDDVVLADKFLDYLNLAYADLPEDYDFLSDCTVFPNERIFDHHPRPILVGSKFICRSDLQNAHLGFMLYSLKGARKILSLLKEHGVFAPIDTMLFYHSRNRALQGYSTFFFNRLIADKDLYGSTIDTHNIRR